MPGESLESRSVRPFATNLNVDKSHSCMIGNFELSVARSLRLARRCSRLCLAECE